MGYLINSKLVRTIIAVSADIAETNNIFPNFKDIISLSFNDNSITKTNPKNKNMLILKKRCFFIKPEYVNNSRSEIKTEIKIVNKNRIRIILVSCFNLIIKLSSIKLYL